MVTGAGSPIGIGHAITLALLQAGARVAMLDVQAAWLAESAAEAQSLAGPGSVLPIVADVSQPEDAQAAVARTVAELGGLNILVNNAGIGLAPGETTDTTDFWDIRPESWFKIAGVNYFGPFLMARAAAPHLLRQRWGRIIGVTTSLDTMWGKRNPAYGTSKAGHEAFVASMSQALEGTGVTANVLVPGGSTGTNLHGPHSTRDRTSMLRPEIMQAPALWLSSPASDGFTGKRIIAQRWDEALPLDERLARASAPAAWQALGRQAIHAG